MKILLLGALGQLGRELGRHLPALGQVKACGRTEADLTSKASVISAIELFRPEVIINAAAYTAVDKAESNRELAFQINAEAAGVLASEACKRDIRLIHYSTDYVFDGNRAEPYTESDKTNPVNVYGESKLAGEQEITSSNCKHLIFRTSWVIGQDGNNFARTILRLAAQRDSLNVVADQIGVPTTAELITRVTIAAIKAESSSTPWPSGLYHLTPRGQTSWFGIAQTLLKLAKAQNLTLSLTESNLSPISTAEYPTPAKRPVNSLLDSTKLQKQLDQDLPVWERDFSKVAQQIIEEYKKTDET